MEEIALGILIGIGISALKRVYRPVAKKAIKLGLTTAEAARTAVHEGEESLSDLVAEAKQEVSAAREAEEARRAAEPGGGGAADPSASN